jgi:AcrR family transcriptional regulator
MGRSQTFDTAEVVRAAREVFWARGYEQASLPELEAATGLNRSSIYHAFGSKRGLFDAAVESYLNEVIRPRLRPLTGAEVARDALLRTDSLPAANGCLLVNTASSPIAHDEAVAETVRAYAAELRAAVTAGIRAHLPEAPASKLQTLADVCTSNVISALALVRISPEDAVRSLDATRALISTH